MKQGYQHECPECEKETLKYGVGKLDGNGYVYPVECVCGWTGYEWYRLVFDGHHDSRHYAITQGDSVG